MKWLKKYISVILLAITFFTGIGLILYPTISNWWNSMHASYTIDSYNEITQEVDHSQEEQLLKEAHEYNSKLLDNPARFFPTEESHSEYMKSLSLEGSELIGSVEASCIDLIQPIYHTTEPDILNNAVGHLEGSSLPVGGTSTHCVLSGHRGLPSSALFDRVPELTAGDIIVLHVLTEDYTYQVDGSTTVSPDDIEKLEIKEGEDLLTLLTCTPYGINTHRILVTAHRIDNLTEEEIKEASPKKISSSVYIWAAAGVLVILFIIFLLWRHKNRKKEQVADHKPASK